MVSINGSKKEEDEKDYKPVVSLYPEELTEVSVKLDDDKDPTAMYLTDVGRLGSADEA